MDETTDLAAWLRQQLDDDEQITLAASRKGSRRWTDHGESEYARLCDDMDEVVVYDEGYPSDAQFAHIARHDPAFVLAEIAAKREIIDLFPIGQESRDGDGNFEGMTIRECGDHRTVGYRAWCFDCSEWCYPDSPCVRCSGGGVHDVLRLLARPYRDRPGWRPEWDMAVYMADTTKEPPHPGG